MEGFEKFRKECVAASQLELLHKDLALLNTLKGTEIEVLQVCGEDLIAMGNSPLLEKLDRMIHTRLDVMISLETSDEETKP